LEQPSKYWYLHNHNLFSQLSEEDIKQLAVISGFKKGKKNDIIPFTDKNVKRIYILKKGILKIMRIDSNAEARAMDIVTAGDIFGEVPVNSDILYSPQYAIVLTDEAIVCTFTLENFEKVLNQNASISLKFIKTINGKIETFRRQYSSLILKDTKTRLLEFLCEFSESYGERIGDASVVKNYLRHQDLADIIGCKRQTVSTLMKELKLENKIDYTKYNLTVFNNTLFEEKIDN